MRRFVLILGIVTLFAAGGPASAADAFLMGKVRAAQATGAHDDAVALLEHAFDALEFRRNSFRAFIQASSIVLLQRLARLCGHC